METRATAPLSVGEMVQKSKDAGEPGFFPIMVRRDVLEKLMEEASHGRAQASLNSAA
jgi:hypothetical protein